jgi:hypothetical protein
LSTPNAEAAAAPPRPTLAAGALLSLWVVILSLPMLAGRWLAGAVSDQYATGYGFRLWGAEQLRETGSVALWNPELFGGMPFVAAQHGDIFYWTSWFRLALPTEVVMNLGFVVHYIAAGVFTYLLLRSLGVSWLGSVVAGAAYQLSGVVGSYPAPGHDGKLFVTALLPLALLSLVLALRQRRWEGFGLLALTVGLALLSPHYQMTYYLLIAAGLFALYLTFGEPNEGETLVQRSSLLGVALVAVLLGFGIAMIQVLPFYHYIPFSPRATGYYGYAGSVSFAIPWVHVPEFFLSGFVGAIDTYWGSNPLKLHSEYLGLSVVALAVLGAAGAPRRTALWLGGIGLLFLLITLGGSTPFYKLWWNVMPFVKQTRAPGMAFFVVALVVALFAGFGAERLERGEGKRHVLAWLGVGAGVMLLALAGAFGAMAEGLARTGEQAPRALAAVADAKSGIRTGAFLSGTALLLLGGIALLRARGKAPVMALLLGVPLILGTDLWLNARPFWIYSEAPREGLYAPDAITERLQATPAPLRVLNLDGYPGSSLMAFGVPQLLGHHGNELHAFDEVMGGKNQWRFWASPRLWDLFAIRYLVTSTGQAPDSVPGFDRVLDGVMTGAGVPATLFEQRDPVRYARMVPAAVKVPDEQAIPIIVDPRTNFDADRVVLLGPETAHEPAVITDIPEPLAVSVAVEEWSAGRMTLRLSEPAPAGGYVVVGENWYPDWHAVVDGQPAEVVRGNVSLITVPVPAGAKVVELEFESADYRLGRGITLVSLLLVAAGIVAPVVVRRRQRSA